MDLAGRGEHANGPDRKPNQRCDEIGLACWEMTKPENESTGLSPKCLLQSGSRQMMRSCPDITHVRAIARHGMRVGRQPRGRGSQHRPLPSMRFGMAIGKREHFGFPVMESARSGEIALRIGDGNFKWRETNTERLDVN